VALLLGTGVVLAYLLAEVLVAAVLHALGTSIRASGDLGLGEVLAFYIAQAFDGFVPSAWSMIFYMSLFFGVIWAAWPIAVRITERYLIKSQVPAGHAPRS